MSKKLVQQQVVSLWNIELMYHYAYCPLPRLWTLTRSWPPATRSTTRPSAAATLFCPRCAWYLASCCLSCHFLFLLCFHLCLSYFRHVPILSLSYLYLFLLPSAFPSCCLLLIPLTCWTYLAVLSRTTYCLPSCCLDLLSDCFFATLFFCYAYPFGFLLISHCFVFILPYSPTW